MNRTQHHEKAEQLLSAADKELDSLRRSEILAEAQVHATLALSAAPETIPSGPDPGIRRQETRSTATKKVLPSNPFVKAPAPRKGPSDHVPR